MPQMTEKDVDFQLNNELLTYYNSVYTGMVPKGMVQIFSSAVWHATPQSHQIRVKSLRALLAKPEGELLVGEIGSITNVLLNTPLDWLYPDFEDALDFLSELEELVVEYNQTLAEFKRSLEKKRLSLLTLIEPGRRNGTNPMQIIR